ncbi:hypothetical protein MIND_00921300 [Mycena indigotica]|uniref:Transmembrane protein n=1 Tax=Mycena indigotica TaxID=2126181 RepID=A0A8H6SDS5_9AGAR|nr:uncharacterized protein MIND_00921300 [Mycena indigotica]KAF7296895.1 hypothetical protein MIND_00921300 [Mycena indigotica]
MPSTSLSQAEAQLYTLLVESIFWGLHVVSLVFCLRCLLRVEDRWKKAAEISKVMLCVVLLMACIGTLDLVMTMAANLNTLAARDGPGNSFNSSGWIDIIGVVDVIVQIILGDVMLIYRCFIVYSRSWRTILVPLVLACCGIVLIILVIFFQITLPSGAQLASPYFQLTIAAWAMTISINIITTGLIIYRIWSVDRNNLQLMNVANRHVYRNAQRVIIESGLLSTTVTAITVVVYITGSQVFSPLTGIDIQVVAIAFNLILIRVHHNRSLEARHATVTLGTSHPPVGPVARRSTLRFAPGTTMLSSVDGGDTVLLSVNVQGSESESRINPLESVDEKSTKHSSDLGHSIETKDVGRDASTPSSSVFTSHV